jgi:transposase
MALRMSLDSGLNNTEIAKYTGIRPRTMRGLLQRYRETGEVVKKPVVSGRPRLMNSLDATVCPHKLVLLHLSGSSTVP